VRCDRNGGGATVQVTVGIGASTSSGSVADRKLRWSAGADLLGYNLYRDAGRLSVWGETAGVDTVTQSLTVPNHGTASTTFTIYGRIGALQDVHPGAYADDLVVTINF
jgi:spore coat protein U-like protein